MILANITLNFFFQLQITHMQPTADELETSYMKSLDNGDLFSVFYISVRKNKDHDEKISVKVTVDKLKMLRDEGPNGVKRIDNELINNLHLDISRTNCILSEINNSFLEKKNSAARKKVKNAIPLLEDLIKQMKNFTDISSDEGKGNLGQGQSEVIE